MLKRASRRRQTLSRSLSLFGSPAFTLKEKLSPFPVSVPSQPRVWEGAFSPDLLAAVTAEAHCYGLSAHADANRGELPIESQVSRWMDADSSPRCAVEVAIQQLRRLFIRGEYGIVNRFVGAEWWVQRRLVNDTLDFHFDIDSCLMHSNKVMRSPEVSSILYLSDAGGPTVVLDQRCAASWLWGHCLQPGSPGSADLLFPRPNQFAIFPGSCLHGVMPDMQARKEKENDFRLTLLVNWWWDEKPLTPCCTPVSDSLAAALLASHSSPLHSLLPASPPPEESPLIGLDLRHDPAPVLAVEASVSLAGAVAPCDFFVPDPEEGDTWTDRLNTRVVGMEHIRRINAALDA